MESSFSLSSTSSSISLATVSSSTPASVSCSCFVRTFLLSFRILNRSCWQSLVVSWEEGLLSVADTALDFLATIFVCGVDEKFILTAVETVLGLMGGGCAFVFMVEAFPSSCSLSNCFKADSGGVIFSLVLSKESCWSTLGRIFTLCSHARLVRSPHWSILLRVSPMSSLGNVVTPGAAPAPVWWLLTRWWAPTIGIGAGVERRTNGSARFGTNQKRGMRQGQRRTLEAWATSRILYYLTFMSNTHLKTAYKMLSKICILQGLFMYGLMYALWHPLVYWRVLFKLSFTNQTLQNYKIFVGLGGGP